MSIRETSLAGVTFGVLETTFSVKFRLPELLPNTTEAYASLSDWIR